LRDGLKVTTIIPNLNGEKWLAKCLDSLLAQTRPADKVVVVDNGSKDSSPRIAAEHPLGVELIRLEKNLGFAAAINRGIEASAGEVVALLNNDAGADSRWVEAGIKALADNPEASIVASLMLDYHKRGLVDSAGDLLPSDGRPMPRGRGQAAAGFSDRAEVLSACAGAAFYRREMFGEVGLFEESFFAYLEDVDLCLRARRSGRAVMFEPEAVVYHHGASTDLGDRPGRKPVDSSERVRLIARNRIRLLARNLPASWLIKNSPWLLIGLCQSAAFHLVRSGQGAAFFAGLKEGFSCWSDDREFHKRSGPVVEDFLIMLEKGARPWRR